MRMITIDTNRSFSARMSIVSDGFIFTDIHTFRTWREGSNKQTIQTDLTSDWSLDECEIMHQYRVHKAEKSFFFHGSSSLLPGGSMSGISPLVNCSSHSYWPILWLVLHLFRTLLQKSATLFHNFTCRLIESLLDCFRTLNHLKTAMLFNVKFSHDSPWIVSKCQIALLWTNGS